MKKMTRYIITVGIAIFNLLLAKEVSMVEAIQVAENLYFERSEVALENIHVEGYYLEKSENINLIYIFNFSPAGFVMIAADDRVRPILGYAFEGEYAPDQAPPQLEQLMNNYQDEIKYAIEEGIPTLRENEELWIKYKSKQISKSRGVRDVQPLIQAQWDQGYPWNAMCPGGTPVGCVAVSMGQIMHYWSHPDTGVGSHSYYHPVYGQLSANFGDTFYDFDNMPDSYPTLATQTVLFHCGVVVEMDYDPEGSGASVGSGYPSAKTALYEHFRYRQDMINYVIKNNYSTQVWIDMLIDELDDARPTIYVGFGDDGGHAWNIDGYQGPDYFHCNWGWGGYANGYFYLDNLSPGGSSFNLNQGMLRGILPDISIPQLEYYSHVLIWTVSDGDGVLNPGEAANMRVLLKNADWAENAENVTATLTSATPGVSIMDSTAIYPSTIYPGGIGVNTTDLFTFELSDDIELGDIVFTIHVSAQGPQGDPYNESFDFTQEVSLNQSGWPYISDFQVESSPIVMDINGDDENEIIFGDYGGNLHVLTPSGVELDNFPFDTGDQIWGSPAVADVDNDGDVEIIITSKSKHLYILDSDGTEQLDYNADQYLMGTPALGDIDGDGNLEIIFGGYSSSGKLFAINPDGSDVAGFPYQLGEKIRRGVALADFNGNEKVDIVCGTDSDNLWLIYDDLTVASGFPFTANGEFRTAPAVVEVDGQKIILAGSRDDNFYAINSDGSLRFTLTAGDDVSTSPGFVDMESDVGIFFGSEDGYLYGVNSNGTNLTGWPKNIGGEINSSPAFADLDGDGNPEIIAATDLGKLVAYHLDGTSYMHFPINYEFSFVGSPIILDTDLDNDLEILIGSTGSVVNIDVKDSLGIVDDYWNMYRGNPLRTGYFTFSTAGIIQGELVPTAFALDNPYPNPFNPTMTVQYKVPVLTSVKISIYNILGQKIAQLVNDVHQTGIYHVNWNASGYPSGIYFVKMIANIGGDVQAGQDFEKCHKILLVK